MSLIFSRQNNVGIVEETVSPQGVVLISPESATVQATSATGISIYFSGIGLVYSFLFSDIQTIGGTTPATIGDAVFLLQKIFVETTTKGV
jgi:predicted transporter